MNDEGWLPIGAHSIAGEGRYSSFVVGHSSVLKAIPGK
jgi:hypothetical protein